MKDKREESEKREKISEALDNISSRHIEEAADFVPTKMPLSRKKIILRCIAVAACIALMLCTVIIPLMFRKDEPEAPVGTEESDKENDYIVDYEPITLDATLSPEKFSGTDSVFIVGNASSGQLAGEPPLFDFGGGGFVVKAKVVENYPYVYSKLSRSFDYFGTYCLIKMEVLEVINGENMPHEFLYLIPQSLFIDMSQYDYLLMSMGQIGTEDYLLKNCANNQIEPVKLPIFSSCMYGDRPDLGSVIAFTDDVFDESLWQNPKWGFGYQFAQRYLEKPEKGNLIVKRGDSIDDVIVAYYDRMEYYYDDNYTPPKLITLDSSNQTVKAALEYVKPFENGVFAQMQLTEDFVIYGRYINGCSTDETIIVNLDTEEVTYSGVRYIDDDMKDIENMAMHLENKVEEYKKQIPLPPNLDIDDKELLRLYLNASYRKVDGKIYGILSIEWMYREKDLFFSNVRDYAYILYDMQNSSAKYVSPQELSALLPDTKMVEWTPN